MIWKGKCSQPPFPDLHLLGRSSTICTVAMLASHKSHKKLQTLTFNIAPAYRNRCGYICLHRYTEVIHTMARYRMYTPDELAEWIPKLLRSNQIVKFYNTHAWLHLRAEVLDEQHHECQICKAKGLATPADTVHHIKTVRDRPDLALTKSNCIAICRDCHYKIHHPDGPPQPKQPKSKRWNDEKW